MPEKKSFWDFLRQPEFVRNPVLIQMLSICTVMAAGTLKMAALLSAAFCVIFFVTQTLANLFMTRWKRYFRVAAYAAIGTLFALVFMLIFEKIDGALAVNNGVYLTMLAVSGVTVLHCEKTAVNVELKVSLQEAAVRAFGYCSVMILAGALRELLGTGALWEYTVIPNFGVAFFAHPASALLILGFLSALLRVLVHRFVLPQAQEVAMKISETPITVAEPVHDEITEETDSDLPEGSDADEIPRPVGYEPPAPEQLDEPEDSILAPQDESTQEITVQPAALEETQQSFEELMADLRKRYLDD
jgi:electron transport complex protein RnfE